jgi:signal transduction histidine kinase
MRALTAGLGAKSKYPIDFVLVPVAIVLIEISVFFTQLAREVERNLTSLILLRVFHTLIMIFTAYLVSQTYKRLQKTSASFGALAITGVLVMAFGDLTHAYFASIFEIELVSIYRRIGIVLIQGSLWFPVFLIFGGNRKEIFHQFREYEKRLFISARAQSRTSQEFRGVQKELQDQIQKQFRESCDVIREAITKITLAGGSLEDQYVAMKPYLIGEQLRGLSRDLDSPKIESNAQNLLRKSRNPIPLFLQQFRILVTSIVQSYPLQQRSYAFVLIALVTPPYINFYSLPEFLISYPILVVTVFVFSYLIVRAQTGKSPQALRKASILILFTGLLPFLFNAVGQAIYHDPQTNFPFYITALIFPIVYFLAMEFLQILRPSALSLIQNDELIASDTLQNKVRGVVREEFTKNLSHEWAVFIHGKVLTRLAATSLKLDAAARNADVHTYNETVQSLLSLLGDPDVDFESASVDLQTEIASRLDPWRGLLDINLQIAPEIASIRNSRVRDIGQVIEELISNSIRHGRAEVINLNVARLNAKDIEIIAIDNSIIPPPETQNRSGLGTRIFNLASDGRWSINRKADSTEFRLTMTLE